MNHTRTLPATIPTVDISQALEHERLMLEHVVTGKAENALSIWSAEQSLVVPKRLCSNSKFAVAAEKSRQNGWPVSIRNTGGDATPQGKGILNVSYAYALDSRPSIEAAYLDLCRPIADFIASLGHKPEYRCVPNAFCDGKFNVGSQGRKIAGTAQRWAIGKNKQKSSVLFAHALILVNADIEKGTYAINSLYKDCSRPERVEPHAHINIADLYPPAKTDSLCYELATFLHQRYSLLLSAQL